MPSRDIPTHESIQGAGLIFRSSTSLRLAGSALTVVALLWATAFAVGARDGSKDWIVLKDCRLIPNPANDGDSFHVSAGEKEYIFRLYLVDAPETGEMTPSRLVQQAQYFGNGVPQAIETGRAATEFTREKLSEPFIVFTRLADALGRSRIERLYAFVQTREGDLGEQLVRNGLARNYGFKAPPPGLKSSRLEMEKLQQFENEAKQEKIGGWGINAGRMNVRAQKPSDFSHFLVPMARSRPTPTTSPTPQVSPTSAPI